jgi:hypothetical protein
MVIKKIQSLGEAHMAELMRSIEEVSHTCRDGQIIVDTPTLSKVMRSMPAVEDSPEPGSSPSKSAPDSYVTLLCRHARLMSDHNIAHPRP